MGRNLPGLHTAELSPTESDRFMHYSLMLSSQVPPEETIGVARLAESAGFNRIWLTEDYYRKAAFASCGGGAWCHLQFDRLSGRHIAVPASSDNSGDGSGNTAPHVWESI